MSRLFRSTSCGFGRTTIDSVFDPSNPSPSLYLPNDADEDEDQEEEYDEDDEEGDDEFFENNPITTSFVSSEHRQQGQGQGQGQGKGQGQSHQFPILGILGAALRKSLATCSVETDVVSSMDIGCPTNVRHVSHVTFDQFNGFLGLPVELEPEVPRRVPSASASVFGVSAKSMQCSFDQRGNSVPTILLMMQKHLYSGGGLQAEGIFRVNADNSQEEYVRNQLNRGFLPRGIDVHCLAGLIKAWFRELPTGVLDSLTPQQVMHCNTQEECTQLVQLIPPNEAALFDWAINLMADVVQHQHHNKMNARNVAMVFAPNMTQMADPLTALIHAVQVMNFLKTLIMKTLGERDRLLSSCADSPSSKGDSYSSNSNGVASSEQTSDSFVREGPGIGNVLRRGSSNTFDGQESETEEKFWRFQSKSDGGEEDESISGRSSPVLCKRCNLEIGFRGAWA